MMRWLRSLILLPGAFLLLTSAAHAQFLQDFQLNVFMAGTAYTKNNFEIGFPQSLTPISGSLRFNESLRGGLRTNVYSRGHWGEELFYSYEPNQIVLLRRTDPESSLKLDIQIHNVGVNALYYLFENETRRTRPFLSVGGGMTIYRLSAEARQTIRDPFRSNLRDMNNSREFQLNYGAGVNQQLNSVLGVRIDGRGFLGRSPSFGLARHSDDPNAVVLPATGALHNLEISAGVIFYFQRD